MTTQRERELEGIIRDTLWMARRYAHGRRSYAVGQYNDAARLARSLGVELNNSDGSIFAVDATRFDGMSGLSEEEFAEAVAGLNAVGITPVVRDKPTA